MQGQDGIEAEAVRIVRVVLVDDEVVTVVAIETILCAKPQEALPVLEHGKYGILREAVIQPQSLETGRRWRRKGWRFLDGIVTGVQASRREQEQSKRAAKRKPTPVPSALDCDDAPSLQHDDV